MSIFLEIGSVIALALGVAFVMRFFKQPLIVGYIIAGLLAGPYVLNLIHSQETIEVFSKLGISILLFIVGLHLSPKVIREVGKVSLLAGVGQVVLSSVVGYIISRILGIDQLGALYIGVGLSFSSTIIILKLLSDKGDLNKLYGKIAIGLMLFQDLVASVVLIVTSTIAGPHTGSLTVLILWSIVKSLVLFDVIVFISAFILPRVTAFTAKSQELLFLFSLAWGIGLASVFSYLGFSIEIGALIAGVSLAATPYSHEMSSRLRPLRDFFVMIFFIFLGSHMVLNNIQNIIFPAVILSLFVLIGNPVIVIIITNLLGYSKRTSFFAGFTITQISEFSLILSSIGFQMGQISQETLSLITLVALITIVTSTYIILHSRKIYPTLSRLLAILELKKNKYNEDSEDIQPEGFLFGYHRMGQALVVSLQKLKIPFIVVDFDPAAIHQLKKNKIPHRYGDAEDTEFLNDLGLKKAKFIVSTIPDRDTNKLLVHKVRKLNRNTIIIVESENAHEAEELYKLGANYVIVPSYLGAEYASKIITTYGLDAKEYDQLQAKHLKFLEKRLF